MAIKTLVDPATGEQFQVEVPDGAGGNGTGAGQQQQQEAPGRSGGPGRTPSMSDKQIKTLLANDGKPPDILKKFWGLGPKLAVTKITSPEEYYRFRLRVENTLRAPYLSNDEEVDETTLLDMDLMDLDAMLDLARSQTDDEHASFLELLTILQQVVRARQETKPVPGSSGSLLGTIVNRISGGRRR